MALQTQDVDQVHASYADFKGRRKDDSFGLLYLKETFDYDDSRLERQIAFGGNDFGIDGYHFDPDRRNFYVYQFKWNNDHSAFKDSLRNLVGRGIEFLFGTPSMTVNPDQFLLKMKSVLIENRAMIDQVMIHFVYRGDPREAEQSEVLTSLREELEGKKYIIDEFFLGRRVGFSFEFRSTGTEAVGGVVHTVKTHRYKLDFHRSISSETPHGQQLQVGFVRLADLYNMLREMGPRFFDKNIRSGLSEERPTNKALIRAFTNIVINETVDPEAFVFNHNGVTIAAEHLELKKGSAYITEPRLLNGAQTVTSLARFIEDHEGHPDFEANLDVLDRIRVLCKVVSSAGNTDFVSNVTICNNRQNPVEPWNLRANDAIQLEFQEKFRHDLGIYYERQEGAFDNLSDDDLGELGIESQKAIQVRKLAQAFLGVQGEIDKMPRMRDVFENETIYRNTFRPSYLKSDARRILLPYKVQFRLNAVVRDIVDKWPNKYHYLGRARNLIWALLVQGLYNDDKIEHLLERFGKTLTIEVDFAEHLKELGSKRVRFLIGDVVESERYREMIEQGKYHVFRTKATYQRCMEAAAERFNWKKKSI